MTTKHLLRRFARKAGLEVSRIDPIQSAGARYAAQRMHHGIDTIVDVEANDGGYGSFLREIGYDGKIVSFGPSSAAPGLRYGGSGVIQSRRLADASHDVIGDAQSLLLKVDTQGFELPVLKGAGELLARTKGVHVELSLVELYAGQESFLEISRWLLERDFRLWNLIPGFVDSESGRLLPFDGVYLRKSSP